MTVDMFFACHLDNRDKQIKFLNRETSLVLIPDFMVYFSSTILLIPQFHGKGECIEHFGSMGHIGSLWT